jgi:xanthine dehydrogenase YagS FAD-binding subunit
MKPFKYVKAGTIKEAQSISPNSKYLAGGTNLVDLMKKNINAPDIVIDINDAISDIIEMVSNDLVIGGSAKNSAIAEDQLVLNQHPLLAKAILQGASTQIRNMASLAGNMMQRTRCPYFSDDAYPCNKRKNGSGCSAINGNNRNGAIIGYDNSCVAVHPSDMCVALVALDAKVVYNDASGKEQKIPFSSFHKLPANNPELDNTIPYGSIIKSIELPKNNFQKNNAYIKIRERDSYAFALVSVAAALEIKKSKIKVARLASGGVAHKPWRWLEAEAFLKNKKPSAEVFKQAAKIAIKDVKPLSENGFKVGLLQGAIESALMKCIS